MTKYIVKNCPCYELGKCNNEHIGDKYCQDCTECTIKQVVKICWVNRYEGGTDTDILEILDVEEVE